MSNESSETQIKKLAHSNGISLSGPIKIDELGLDFRAAFATDDQGQKWVLRIPRRDSMGPQILKEAQSLAFIQSKVKFQVPRWIVSQPELVAYPLLLDRPALAVDPETHNLEWRIDVAGTSGERFTQSLAEALVDLHRIPVEDAVAAGLAN